MQLKTLQKNIKDFLQDKRKPTEIDVTPLYGLNIYKQNYFKSLSGALASKYPVAIKHLAGSRQELLHNFICKFPSNSPDLDDYGDNFIEYLFNNNFTPIAKLAEIDLEIFISFKKYEKPIDASGLAHITPDDFDRLTLKLNAALRLIKVSTQDFETWKESNQNFALVRGSVHQQGTQQSLAISPVKDQIMINIIPASYHEALALVKNQENLLAIAAKVLAIDSNFNLSEFLGFCFKNNLITSFNLTK